MPLYYCVLYPLCNHPSIWNVYYNPLRDTWCWESEHRLSKSHICDMIYLNLFNILCPGASKYSRLSLLYITCPSQQHSHEPLLSRMFCSSLNSNLIWNSKTHCLCTKVEKPRLQLSRVCFNMAIIHCSSCSNNKRIISFIFLDQHHQPLHVTPFFGFN